MIPKDLLKLFERRPVSNYGKFGKLYRYYRLNGTLFTYVHRREYRWIDRGPSIISYVSFEYVLDNVNEDTQTQLLFHLDYFTRGVE